MDVFGDFAGFVFEGDLGELGEFVPAAEGESAVVVPLVFEVDSFEEFLV